MTCRQAVMLCGVAQPFGPLREGGDSFCLQTVVGKPLLAHVAEALAGAGIERLLLLPDAAPGAVRAYGADGARWGLAVEYADAGAAQGILETLHSLRPRLEERFLLLCGPVLVSSQALRGLLASAPVPAWLGPQGGEAVFLCDRELCASGPAGLRDGAALAGHLASSCGGGAMPDVHAFAVLNAVDLWRANLAALGDGLPHLVLPGMETGPGVRRGAGVGLSSQARLVPPVFLGSGCTVGRGAVVGPGAVIGEGAIIEDGAEVHDAVVLAGSYVGPETTVAGALVAGSVLVRCPDGVEVHVPDPFVLGSAVPKAGRAGAGLWAGRFVSLVALLLASPLLAGLVAAHLVRPGAKLLARREVAGRMGEAGLSGERSLQTVQLHVFGRGVGVLGRLPGLWDAVAGRVALVGPEPVSAQEASAMAEPWMRGRFEVPPGLVQPWHALARREWEDIEKRVMEVHYAASRSPFQDAKILGGAVVRWVSRLRRP